MVFPELSPQHQQFLSQMTDAVNSLSGYNGPISLKNHIDLGGHQVKNMGAATDSTDALTSGAAESSYSAEAVSSKLQSNGSNPLNTYRALNSNAQREQSSSYLNDLMSTVPSANAIIPLTTTLSSAVRGKVGATSGVTVTIPAGPFVFADGSSVMLLSRHDALSLPASYAITSISCVGNLVTVVTSTPTGLTVGGGMTITGVSPSGFNGSFPVTQVIDQYTFTYQDDLGTVGGSGGSVELNNVYYYYVRKRSNIVHLSKQFSGDTAQNRLQVNLDGAQIVAVVVLTNSGHNVASSGGGGSIIVGSPTAGSFF